RPPGARRYGHPVGIFGRPQRLDSHGQAPTAAQGIRRMSRSRWSVIALCVVAAQPGAHARPTDPVPVPPRAEPAPEAVSPQAHMPLKMELPTQPLADAMQAIARLAGLNILADPALVAPHRA